VTIDSAMGIAHAILDGFDLHYWLFGEYCEKAREHFERGEWAAGWDANRARIDMYDQRVAETVEGLLQRFPRARRDEALWRQVKLAYIALLFQGDHLQPECAETFYNSVACRVLHRRYYNNEHIFWRPAVATEHLEGLTPTYRCYDLDPRCPSRGLRRALREIAAGAALTGRLASLSGDLRALLRQLRDEPLEAPSTMTPASGSRLGGLQIQVLSSLFYRNQAAYLLGRLVSGAGEHPFAAAIRRNPDGTLYLDALLTRQKDIATLFSLARAYFMVAMEVPSAYVAFLQALMPGKPRAELYTAVGLQKQGKTLLYRDLQQHLRLSSDPFVIAPGTPGMVMLVFTLPSLPYVFKVIRDAFAPPKQSTEEEVRAKYLLVKHHDRVGRMADTLEYSDVAFPRARFAPELLEALLRQAGRKVELDGERLVIRHLYIERRMVPLDLYLREANEEQLRHGVLELGDAIRELAAANIFPGDLLTKNFGVTRYGRVVFYDYDELCYLTECRFRRIPAPRSWEDELSAEPYYSVGESDVFPEQFPTFLFPPGRARELFLQHHGDLQDPAFWSGVQDRVRAGVIDEVFPYPQALRLRRRYPRPPRPHDRRC
jgi:isocitrate dehydrogenase kinase/phosphatase